MDSFELNKIAGAVIAGLLILFGIDTVGGMLVNTGGDSHGEAQMAHYTPDGIEAFQDGGSGAAQAAAAPAEPEVPLAELMAMADPAKGEKVFKKCKSCHTAEAGGKDGQGPALHGIVGRAIAGKDGFSYSEALKAVGGNWTPEQLSAFLAKPKEFAKGTKMNFAGLKKATDRAAVIVWLQAQ